QMCIRDRLRVSTRHQVVILSGAKDLFMTLCFTRSLESRGSRGIPKSQCASPKVYRTRRKHAEYATSVASSKKRRRIAALHII
ncbi:MAG: hypothetical protein N3B12_02230, partial [Armatimonadetes bacterium]|nr:hypothetical protein [Armatimonadota bacterium]